MIGGVESTDASGGVYEHVNPSTNRGQADVPMAGADEVEAAVVAARAGFAIWRNWAPADRRRVLNRLADLLRAHSDEFLSIQALETGIPVATGGMLGMLIDATEYCASEADKLHGRVIATARLDVMDYTLVEPIGVVAVIVPWNGPVGQLGLSALPPLAAGCAIILKPSELAPFSSMLFGRLCKEAGIPDGVVNVITGGPEAGQLLCSHPGIDKVSFTGSYETSLVVGATAAGSGKSLMMELGGKSADLVFGDADVPKAAADAVGWLVFNSGQACTLASRFLVHESIYDEYVGLLTDQMRALRPGDAIDPETSMGPVITAGAADRILGMIDRAKDGNTLATGGGRADLPGFHVEPTLFVDVDPASEIARKEVFGPVYAVMKFSDEDEAIALANSSEFGLAAYVHTSDVSRAIRVAAQLEAGTVGVNGGVAPSMAAAPFGGVKHSGYGRAGGIEGLLEFCTVKNVNIPLSRP
ncbi:betaine-aldehyde dehydrogenase [Agrococcus baldri]|uniref:Betaine-aldehyde dehydrogenase n=1 Tax=Agrococcus baldri TaxID=153730 RepID=A0AA87UQX3_9MICO|nr:betaine-aldehyde dehydrogenase [Agrococcus baldri]